MIKRSRDQKQAQRKLQVVKRQLYGTPDRKLEYGVKNKEERQSTPDSTNRNVFSFRSSDVVSNTHSINSDINYLNQDLYRIFIYSGIAIAVQLGLFLAIQKDLIQLI